MLIPLSIHILGNVSLLGESDPIPHFVQSNVAVSLESILSTILPSLALLSSGGNWSNSRASSTPKNAS